MEGENDRIVGSSLIINSSSFKIHSLSYLNPGVADTGPVAKAYVV